MHPEHRAEYLGSFDINPVCGEFCDDVTENRFLAHQLADTHTQLRIALAMCSFFYMAFTLSDIAALGWGRSTCVLFLGRLTVIMSAVIGIGLTYRRPACIALTRWTATVVEVVGMSVFMLVVVYRPNELEWHAMSMALMLVVVYLFIPNRLVLSMAVALSATVAFVSLALAVANLKPSDIVTLTMLLVLANTFGFAAARRYQRLWRREYQAQSDLLNLSLHDHLTGCLNRRYLNEKLLDNELKRAKRYGLCMTVVMCDLDHFKAVNDRHGHQVGDAVLRDFSQLLKNTTRKHIDSVVRYGGEEFLLILPETNLQDGVLLAERLRSSFAGTVKIPGVQHKICVTASFGAASIDFAKSEQKFTLECLIACADRLLYEAKSAGRNRVRSMQMG